MRRKRKTSGVKKTLKYTALAGAGAFAAATAFFFKGAVCLSLIHIFHRCHTERERV